MAQCNECGEEYSDKRAKLGYEKCLNCGDMDAKQQAFKKSKRVGLIYSKGAYQYITDGTDVETLGKKV